MSDPALQAEAPISSLVEVPETSSPVAVAPARRLPWALLVPVAIIPVLLAVVQLGRWHPDEVYQFLEPAFMKVNGYGIRAWEWQAGLRNWAAPLVLAFFLKVSSALGITDPRGYRAVLALPQLLLQLAMVAALWRYLERRLWRTGMGWTTLAFALVALCAPLVLFSGRIMGESLSAALLVIAFDRLDREGDERTDGIWAGAALGLSVVVRYGSAVFVASALVWLLATRRWRMLLWTCAAGAVVAIGLGALDAETWGKPFHSLRAYLDFNVFSDRAARQFGEAPAAYYLPFLAMWVAAWVWPGAVASAVREKRLPAGLFAALVYLAAISATPHKEERFLYPALVLLAMGAAPGAVWLIQKVRSAHLRVLAAVAALAAGSVAFAFAPDFRGDEFHGIVKATRDDKATGLLIIGDGLWGSGGHFYIGKNIPFWNAWQAEQVRSISRNPQLNRVVAMDGMFLDILQANGFVITEQIDRATVLRRGEQETNE